MITTAQDAGKAAIAFLKNLDDVREISVEQVTSNDKDHEWTFLSYTPRQLPNLPHRSVFA
jgi:hypothetical protein